MVDDIYWIKNSSSQAKWDQGKTNLRENETGWGKDAILKKKHAYVCMLCHEKEKLKVLEPHVMILLYPHFDSPVQLGTTEEGQYLLSEVAWPDTSKILICEQIQHLLLQCKSGLNPISRHIHVCLGLVSLDKNSFHL